MDRLTKYTAELRKRLIDLRDELETAYDSISQLDGANSSLMAANEKLAADRKALPAADVMPVVLCKECKHYEMGVCLKIYQDGNLHSEAWQPRKPEDFCSYGERKGKNETERT